MAKNGPKMAPKTPQKPPILAKKGVRARRLLEKNTPQKPPPGAQKCRGHKYPRNRKIPAWVGEIFTSLRSAWQGGSQVPQKVRFVSRGAILGPFWAILGPKSSFFRKPPKTAKKGPNLPPLLINGFFRPFKIKIARTYFFSPHLLPDHGKTVFCYGNEPEKGRFGRYFWAFLAKIWKTDFWGFLGLREISIQPKFFRSPILVPRSWVRKNPISAKSIKRSLAIEKSFVLCPDKSFPKNSQPFPFPFFREKSKLDGYKIHPQDPGK